VVLEGEEGDAADNDVIVSVNAIIETVEVVDKLVKEEVVVKVEVKEVEVKVEVKEEEMVMKEEEEEEEEGEEEEDEDEEEEEEEAEEEDVDFDRPPRSNSLIRLRPVVVNHAASNYVLDQALNEGINENALWDQASSNDVGDYQEFLTELEVVRSEGSLIRNPNPNRNRI